MSWSCGPGDPARMMRFHDSRPGLSPKGGRFSSYTRAVLRVADRCSRVGRPCPRGAPPTFPHEDRLRRLAHDLPSATCATVLVERVVHSPVVAEKDGGLRPHAAPQGGIGLSNRSDATCSCESAGRSGSANESSRLRSVPHSARLVDGRGVMSARALRRRRARGDDPRASRARFVAASTLRTGRPAVRTDSGRAVSCLLSAGVAAAAYRFDRRHGSDRLRGGRRLRPLGVRNRVRWLPHAADDHDVRPAGVDEGRSSLWLRRGAVHVVSSMRAVARRQPLRHRMLRSRRRTK